jgi:hypothetical protein
MGCVRTKEVQRGVRGLQYTMREGTKLMKKLMTSHVEVPSVISAVKKALPSMTLTWDWMAGDHTNPSSFSVASQRPFHP